jgi:THO complex subunit 2
VTDTIIEDWLSTGRQKLVEDGIQIRNAQDDVRLAAMYQEVIRSAFYGRMSPTDAGSAVKDIIGEDVAAEDVDMDSEGQATILDTRSLFLDTLSIVTDSDPSNPALRPLVFSTAINPALMRLQLDTPLLQSLGLVRETFARMGIRKQTNLLYRQSNYNLLREESEGYSKLLTELFTTSNNEPPSSEVVEDTFEKVKAMIGAFDMDVGRVLDVTLDVFAAVLVKQYRFFVKLLRASSWWPKEDTFRTLEGSARDTGLPNWALPGSAGWVTTDEERAEAMRNNKQRDRQFWDRVKEVGIRAFFEIGRRPVSEEELKQILPETNNLSEEELETRKWIAETGTLPPKGNRVAAQLLGFKLRFYSSRARSKSDVLPDNLIYLAALLIKVGFISLRDLYPHLWRPDDSMDALKEEKMKEKAERERAARPGGGVNALMLAGALSDDTLPTPRIRESETRSATPGKEQDADKPATKPEENDLPEPSDQKVQLLKSLLAIGALPESLFILSKFPWLMDVYPELPEFIHRILHQCLSKVYASLRPIPDAEDLREQQQIPSHDQTGLGKGQIRLCQAPPRRVLRWAQLDKEDTNDGTDYRFYWDDWADNVPLCQTVDDVFALCSSFLNLSGHKIGQDPSLLTKLARIGKHSLNKDDSPENRARWQDLCKRLLLPSISLTKANPGVVNEVFDLVSFFPRETRYNMYAEWNFGQTSRLPDIKSAFDLARAETKDVLKRLSKTNIRPMARALAKIAYANPGIVINVAISQIESYENLIEVVVECARYFTYLGYDILTWALISSLGQKGRSRVQEGGLLTSRWLNALSTFAGRTFKRYSVMDPTPLLQYVVEQLKHNNSTDLIVLEQLISSMAGIITDTNFNDSQIQAMAGGEVLQAQTILQLLDRRHESKTTSKRLMKSLTVSKLAGQLLIAIAQERWTCIYKESDGSSELKLLGNIFDEIHRVLAQYLDLLRSNLSVEEFDSFVPDLASLIKEFGIQPEVAFWIRRPSIAKRIAQDEALKGQDEDSPSQTEKMETADDGEAAAEGEVSESMDVDKEQSDKNQSNSGSTEQPSINPVMQEMQDQVKSVLSSDTWGVVGLQFYTTFWQLSLYDVHVPQKAYEDEIDRQKRKVVQINSDRSDISIAGSQRKESQKKQVTQLQERILEENKAHLKAYGQMRAKLQKEKDRWFFGMRGKHDSLNVSLLEQCFLPRLLLSPIDAFYCFKLLKFLHASGTPNFRTVGLLDQLFREQRLTALIFLCTSREADNLGRFLNEILRDLSRWHADKAVYEKEAFGTKKDLPGFAMTVDPEGKPTTFLDYEDFRRLLYKWHRLFSSALKTCLNGGEYMHIRNAISVLKAVVQHFPAVNWIGRDMLVCVNTLSQKDERDDVKIPAASLIGDLNRREKKWLLPQAFMITSQPAPKGSQNKPDADRSKPSTPRPETTPGPLNAAAPEFKPSTTESQGATKPETKTEVEDGEIEDAKMTDAPKPTQDAESAQNPTEDKEPTTELAPKEAPHGTNEEEEKPSTDDKDGPQPLPTAESQTPKGPEPRHPNIPKRPDVDRPSAQSARSSHIHTPGRSFREESRLPPRPDLMDDRRDRHPDYPRGRFGEHDYNRSFDQPMGDGRYDRLGRDYPPRQPMDESFRGPYHRDSRLPREPDWPDRGRGARGGPTTHPDRMEMIQDLPDREAQRRGDPTRHDKDDRRSLSSRLSPPKDLPSRPERFPDGRRPHMRHEDLPTGPRGDRPGRGGELISGGDSREPPTGPDMTAGRLRQPEPADIPAGPRGRNQPRGGRQQQQQQQPGPAPSTGPASQERQPPTGPSRQMRTGPEQQPQSAPPSPSAERLDTSGIHPDRLRNLQEEPPQGGGYNSGRGPPAGPVLPPSGPRSAGGAHTRGQNAPGFGGDRGRGDKRFAGINNMLQQTGGPPDRAPPPVVRGRGANRQASAQGGRPQTSGGPPDLLTPRAPQDDDQPRRRGEQDETAGVERRPPRYSTGSYPHDRERERERDRERDRERERREDDGSRSSRREEHRDRNRDYERERSRRSDAGSSSREERFESREASRRGPGSREDNRRRRDREDAPEATQGHDEGRLRPPSSLGGQPPPPPPPPPPPAAGEGERRWAGGRDRDRDRNRDRQRDREYQRESGGGSGGVPHKRRRGDDGGRGEGSGRGGMRTGGDNKRPRRGA